MAAGISACATTGRDDAALSATDRAVDYPVQIVAVRSVPKSHFDIANIDYDIVPHGNLPATGDVNASTSGKVDGAVQGAGRGALECGLASAGAGPYFPFIFVPCAALAVPVLAVVGAWEAAPKEEVVALRQSAVQGVLDTTQGALAEKTHTYLAAISGQPVIMAPANETARSGAAVERPDYPPQPGANGTLLEVGLLKIRFAGSGMLDDPLCLHMAARGRKLDAATGKPIQELEHDRIIECHQAGEWVKAHGALFGTALANGQQMLAEHLVDRLYLIYRPTGQPPGADTDVRKVPRYVLAPVSPPAPDIYLDFRSMTNQARHVQGWGGMHFVDIDSLTPTLSWEAFPRPFDLPSNVFSDITYEVRLYSGEVLRMGVAEPAALLQEATGLVEPHHLVTTPLRPCSRYFWTVRARFTLNGKPRVTEWAGAYDTAGGEVAPSHQYYYPFRTPAVGDDIGCWD